MTGADPSPVDRKNLKLISNVEKTDKKNYEAVFNFNGIKEAIVSRRGPVLEIYKHLIVTILFSSILWLNEAEEGLLVYKSVNANTADWKRF